MLLKFFRANLAHRCLVSGVKQLIAFFAVAVLLLASQPLFAEPALDQNSPTKQVYRIGVEDLDYYPHYAFGYRDDSFAKALFEDFFHSEQLEVQFIPLPLKRFNQWLLEQDIDFKYPDNPVWRQNESNPLPVIYSEQVIELLAGTIVPIDKVGMKRNNIHRVGTILGFHPTLWMDRIAKQQTQVLTDPNVVSVIKMPLNGLVDAIDMDYSVVHFHLQAMNHTKALVVDKSLPHHKIGYYFSTLKYPELIARFNQYQKDNQVFIQQLKIKYDIIETPFDLNSF